MGGLHLDFVEIEEKFNNPFLIRIPVIGFGSVLEPFIGALTHVSFFFCYLEQCF
jgi:hypothetical protein